MATTNVQKFAGDVDVGGTVTGDGSGLTTLNGSQVTTGTVAAARIDNLDGSKITTGTVAAARIDNLDGSKITTGTVAAARIDNLDASKITSGTLGTARIPNLDASKITAGTISRPVDTTGSVKAASLYTDRYIYHEGDTNTYIDFSAADTLRIVTAGSERLRIESGGDVGIGTNNPAYKLHVNGVIMGENPAFFYASREPNSDLYNQKVIFDTVFVNTGLYSGTNGNVTIPITGYYSFNCWGMTSNAGNAWLEYYLRKNGTEVRQRVYSYANNSPYTHGHGHWIVYCAAGDSINVFSRGYWYGGTVNDYNGFGGFYLSA